MTHKIHEDHPHEHGTDCGHVAIQHGDHIGYLHDGHLHEDHYDEHVIEVSATNPDGDYLVDGHLHHPHGDHCDDHGPVTRVSRQSNSLR